MLSLFYFYRWFRMELLSLSRSSLQFDTLLSDRWYGFIKCDFMVIKTLTLIKAAMIGCLVTVQAQAQAHSLIYFFFIGNWCVFFLLFTLLLRRFSSIHSMCFSSICIWHADQIDSINNFIFSTEKMCARTEYYLWNDVSINQQWKFRQKSSIH